MIHQYMLTLYLIKSIDLYPRTAAVNQKGRSELKFFLTIVSYVLLITNLYCIYIQIDVKLLYGNVNIVS